VPHPEVKGSFFAGGMRSFMHENYLKISFLWKWTETIIRNVWRHIKRYVVRVDEKLLVDILIMLVVCHLKEYFWLKCKN